MLTNHQYWIPKLRMSGAIPLPTKRLQALKGTTLLFSCQFKFWRMLVKTDFVLFPDNIRQNILKHLGSNFHRIFHSSAEETGDRKLVNITGSQCCGRGPGSRLFFHFFFGSNRITICRKHKLTNPCIPSWSHSATKSLSFRFIVKIFGLSFLAERGGGPRNVFFFSLGPNPLSAAMCRN
jgi:hypothetical protein